MKAKQFLIMLFTLGASLLLITSSIQAQDTLDTTNSYIEELEKALVLNMPEVTDNPDYNITFTDPSGKGVTLIIDEDETYSDIDSPYKLPTLGIGQHTMLFEFYDADETKQALEKEIVIIPRPPQISTRTEEDGNLKLAGTAVGDATIEVFISDGRNTVTQESPVDKNGNWELTIEENLNSGRYIIAAIVRKNGIASSFSEVSAFDLQDDGASDSKFSFYNEYKIEAIQLEELPNIILNNQNVAIYTITLVVLGLFFGYVIKTLMSSSNLKGAEKMLREALGNKNSQAITDTKGDPTKARENIKRQENSKEKNEKKEKSDSESEKPEKKTGGLFSKLFGGSKKKVKTDQTSALNALAKKNNLKEKLQASLGKNVAATTAPDKKEDLVKDDKEKTDILESLDKSGTTQDKSDLSKENESLGDSEKSNSQSESKENDKTGDESESTMNTPEIPDPDSKQEDSSSTTKKNMAGKVLNKEDFLKEFEKFDPDDEEGNERPRKMNDSDILQSMSSENNSAQKLDAQPETENNEGIDNKESKDNHNKDDAPKESSKKTKNTANSEGESKNVKQSSKTAENADKKAKSSDETKSDETATDLADGTDNQPQNDQKAVIHERKNKEPKDKSDISKQVEENDKTRQDASKSATSKTSEDSTGNKNTKKIKAPDVPDSRNIKITLTSQDSEGE